MTIWSAFQNPFTNTYSVYRGRGIILLPLPTKYEFYGFNDNLRDTTTQRISMPQGWFL